MWERLVGLQRIKISPPLIKAGCIANSLIPTGKIGAVMINKYRYVWLIVIGKFAIGTVGNTIPLTEIPDKSILVVGYISVSLCVIFTTSTTIAGGPCRNKLEPKFVRLTSPTATCSIKLRSLQEQKPLVAQKKE